MTSAQYRCVYELIKDTPYLALTGELWSVFCEYFLDKWPQHKDVRLYQVNWASKWGPYNQWQRDEA